MININGWLDAAHSLDYSKISQKWQADGKGWGKYKFTKAFGITRIEYS